MSNVSRRRPRRARLTAATLTVTMCGALSVSGLAQGLSAGAPGAALAATVPSPFGDLVYDDTPNCAAGDVEVAYVANRVIVQTRLASLNVAKQIDAWLAATPAPSSTVPARSGFTVAGARRAQISQAAQTRVVDAIHFPDIADGDDPIAPVYAFELPGDGPHDVLGVARFLTSKGIAASPDYVTRMQGGHDFFQPDGLPTATTALPVPRRPFAAGDPALGGGVRVAVFDTGLAATTEPALLPNVGALRTVDVEVPDRIVPGVADDLWVGHGLAISSEIAAMAPGAAVSNARVTRSGISTDFTSAKRIVAVLANTAPADWPHLIVAAFATMACEIDPAVPGDELVPVSLRAASETVDRLSSQRPSEMAIVAAAGNHGTGRRGYPAAFDGVIAVGALDTTRDADGDALTSPSRTGPVADFSARGSWVDLYAPGQDIVALHVDGITFELVDENGVVTDSVQIEGRALVQGTSFAAPGVAAQLAELMSTHRVAVGTALDLLRSGGVAPQPPCDGSSNAADLGPGLAVALVDATAPSDAPATAPPTKLC